MYITYLDLLMCNSLWP